MAFVRMALSENSSIDKQSLKPKNTVPSKTFAKQSFTAKHGPNALDSSSYLIISDRLFEPVPARTSLDVRNPVLQGTEIASPASSGEDIDHGSRYAVQSAVCFEFSGR